MRTLTNNEEYIFLCALDPRYLNFDCRTTAEPYINDTIRQWQHCRNLLTAILMLDAGLRLSEALGLIMDDVYFNNGPKNTLVVRAEIAKTKKERHIPMSHRLKKSLIGYAYGPIYTDANYPDKHLIRANPFVNSISGRAIQYAFAAASMKSLGWVVHPHLLRHTFGTKLLQVTNIRTVQELLGHAALSSTQIYTHVNDEDKNKAIALLSN